ncbi:YkvA family protein [Fictibacillus sp. Mic-4]|uniref:YkvA family protein n=1 Tax=Fictibacillus sp. Mic-4 TaxID=3132826 RepID=UPI003CEC31A1
MGNINLRKWKVYAKKLKSELYTLYLANKHPKVPWYTKIFSICVVAYAFSPVDLVPDFIPILGYLDDLILVPLGIYFAFKMMPGDVVKECRKEAERLMNQAKPRNWITGGLIIILWMLIALWIMERLFF